MSKNFNWSLLERKWTGVDRVEVSANILEDLVSHTSRIESNLCDQKVGLDTLSTRFTALIQQNNALAAEYERLSEKLAAMESVKPAGRVIKWINCNTAICSGEGFAYANIDAEIYFKPVPADKPAVAVPEGWKLVPIDLDAHDGMVDAACDAGNLYRVDFVRAWEAALAYAPSHSQQSEEAAVLDDDMGGEALAATKIHWDEFESWWEDHGQYIRAGGGQYEKTFAWKAWNWAIYQNSQQSARITEQDARQILNSYSMAWEGCENKPSCIKLWLDNFGGRELLAKLNADRCPSHESEQGGEA